MPVDDHLLKLLRCPLDGGPLAAASQELVDWVNSKIDAGQLSNRIGETLDEPLAEGLVSDRWFYPVRDDIPTLIADQAIELVGLPDDLSAVECCDEGALVDEPTDDFSDDETEERDD
ncbi:MAG: hypothetical protein QGG36_21330 [Pirellulaceae bacterium]|jgi:uncharacterized protein YbaR (Trm112 family)|nr:hypothetical protein [Pirellulaceae bacterium]MDP7018363.1 hypothetical protein [Pirellulaceae bacterium]